MSGNEWENVSLRDCLPHGDKAMLLDHIISCDEQSLRAVIRLNAANSFVNNERQWPSWLSVEMMSQAAAGWRSLQGNKQTRPQAGYLISIHSWQSEIDYLLCEQSYTVSACLDSQAGSCAVFNCTLNDRNNLVLITARISVYMKH